MTTSDINSIWDSTPQELAQQLGYKLTPLWTLDFDDEAKVKEWHKETLPVLKNISLDFSERCLINLMLLRGLTDFDNIDSVGRSDNVDRKSPQISVNMVYELTDVWVNRMSKYKAKISVLPKNNDSSARQDAKMKQLVIDDSFTRNKINFMLQKLQLYTRSMGEGYIVCDWNPDLGGLHPEQQEAKKKNKKIMIDSPVTGEQVPLEREVHIGDVEYRLYEPYRVLFPLEEWDKTDYYAVIDLVEPEKLATDYPDVTIDSKGTLVDGKVELITYYHPPTKYLPKGRRLKFAGEALLENIPYPYSIRKKNAVRLTDIDVPNQPRGKSFIENIATQQILTNKVMGANWRNISISSHAKWVAPRNSINFKNLGNQANVLEYSGAQPPTLVKYSGLSPESFTFLELLSSQAEKVSRLQGVTRGDPPPNVRSGMQMAQLEEAQQSAVTFDIEKRNMVIEDLANIALSIFADYADETDGRLLRIVGKDKGHLVKALKVESLQGEHTIEIKNNNGLPEGKYEKLSMLMELNAAFPDVVPQEVILDAFELGQVDRYTDYATVSVEKAESENEEMLDGSEPPMPEPYDDHIAEWKVHVVAMRRRSFADASPEVKQLFEDHILTHEYLMEKQAMINPAFGQKLQLVEGYPIFYNLTPSAQMPEDASASAAEATEANVETGATDESMVDDEALME